MPTVAELGDPNMIQRALFALAGLLQPALDAKVQVPARMGLPRAGENGSVDVSLLRLLAGNPDEGARKLATDPVRHGLAVTRAALPAAGPAVALTGKLLGKDTDVDPDLLDFFGLASGPASVAVRGGKAVGKGLVRELTEDGVRSKVGRAAQEGYIGEKSAKGADLKALERAKRMDKAGKSADEIREATGWWRGPQGGGWRFEGDDSAAKIIGKSEGRMKAKNWIRHDKLFSDYPEKADQMVVFFDGPKNSRGAYDTASGDILINKNLPLSEQKRVFLHETTHDTQKVAGFHGGGSFIDDKSLSLDERRNRYAGYRGKPGEAEARAVARRSEYTPFDREARAFKEDYDTPWEMLTKEPEGTGGGRQMDENISDTLEGVSRSKRRVGTTGEYVGAPPGIDTPQKFSALVDAYEKRIQQAVDAGVPRGYFYARDSALNKRITDSPGERKKLAMTEGVTSAQNDVGGNFGQSVKAFEEDAMGVPVSVGRYPNTFRPKVERVLAGDDSHIGTKTHRFSAGLNDEPGGLAPNDMWEGRAMGYERDQFSPTQHAFMDEVRARAVARWNAKHPNVEPLSVLEGQELHWATARATLDPKFTGTIKDAAESYSDYVGKYAFQHSWESRGGTVAKHLNDIPEGELGQYHDSMRNIFIDDTGKDRLVRAMGGRLQLPAVDGPGLYTDAFGVKRVSPGTQSRSLVYQTDSGGIGDASKARVTATEALRAWMLGQDAYAGHAVTTPSGLKGGKGADTALVRFGGSATPEQATEASKFLEKRYGTGEYGQNADLVPAEGGFNALRFNEDPKFFKDLASQAPELARILGVPGVEIAPAKRSGIYDSLGWDKGTATADMLKTLDAAPTLRSLAGSPEARRIAGQVANEVQAQLAQGRTPNPKLLNALRVLETEGLEGLERLVAKGLAPGLAGISLGGLALSGSPDYQ